MWKQGFIAVAVLLMGLGSGSAEARFGKRPPSSSSPETPSSPPSTPRPSNPGGGGWGRPGYDDPYYGYGYYGVYGAPWVRYYYDPAWAWPYLGPGRPYFYGRYYDLAWRRRLMPRPSAPLPERPTKPTRVDLSADAGFVSQGYAMGLGLQMDGDQLTFNSRLNVFNVATDDGTPGRDTLTLLSFKPGVMLVSREELLVRLLAGVDLAFAPDALFVGPGVGASTLMRVTGPLELEASAHWTFLPYTQLSGEAGVALELGPMRLRGGYRATYLDDQGRLDPSGQHTWDFFAGPYVGVALVP